MMAMRRKPGHGITGHTVQTFSPVGSAYAQFLDAHGEERECEKVMLYILSNVKKSTDLDRVAAVIVDKQGSYAPPEAADGATARKTRSTGGRR
ncbi:MAG: hypothetical protein MZV70_30680 [Desulfobacterales bacterium]|nr:hypothetical protein [Desulfobacterales bacterium]